MIDLKCIYVEFQILGSTVGIGNDIAIAIGHRRLKTDRDSDSDADSENAFPAALSGSQAKATGFAGGYLIEE